MTSQRQKVVLYNPRAVVYKMPLALLAVRSVLDPECYEVVIIDSRLESDPDTARRMRISKSPEYFRLSSAFLARVMQASKRPSSAQSGSDK